jgi:hypothetical protein
MEKKNERTFLLLSPFVKNISTNRQERIRNIKKYGIAAIGRSELIAHLQGHRLYASKAIRAFCYDCMGWYADGKKDCQQENCPLYPFMPYKTTPCDAISSAASEKREDDEVIIPSDSRIAQKGGGVSCA